MVNDQPIEVAVIGVGRMGRHHARTYGKLADVKLVAVVDPDEERAETVADEYGCAACDTLERLFAQFPDVAAVTVATPTSRHLATAEPLLRRGVSCLIEKPLAPTLADAKKLASLAEQSNALLQVGHTERFNPAVRAVRAMNIPARFIEVDRVSPMSFRSLDVGVVMDLMIHDLDIVLTLANSKLERVDAVGVAVLGEHEDVANARLTFGNGCVANLTASRAALKTERKLRLFSEQAYVSMDYQRRSGVVIHKTANAEMLERVRDQLATGADLSTTDYAGLVTVDELTMDLPEGEDDPLTAELRSFVDAVRRGGPPEVDAVAGYAAVDAAERVVEAIRAHRWEGLSDPRV